MVGCLIEIASVRLSEGATFICMQRQVTLFNLYGRILQDTAKSMVKFSDYALKNRFETLKICLGPMMYQLVCFHPDSIRIVYKSGKVR